MNHKIRESELLEPLIQKDFKELSLEEKSLVLQHITEEEFNALRKSSKDLTRKFDQDRLHINPDKEIKGILMEKFREKKQRKYLLFSLASILNYRIPAYQPALAFLALLLLYFFINHKSQDKLIAQSPAPIPQEIQEVKQTEILEDIKDTIFNTSIGRELAKTFTQVKDSVHEEKTIQTVPPLPSASAIAIYSLKDEKTEGSSLNEDTLLTSFFTIPN
ncbi:MAG: hypothetical protein J7604_06050 [Sporocytophaga sp.]|uniref:hypothetical protein n=1 Tax=Sporocytophaga sp. TaxID=2231183 RepID=UPI001B2B9158|nr:hypothetical protein [Sporocytophaga sp.]MBO9699754.1 hypothetical protein [Sporocytophaga sp.]